jgi:hypothetical protein
VGLGNLVNGGLDKLEDGWEAGKKPVGEGIGKALTSSARVWRRSVLMTGPTRSRTLATNGARCHTG